MSDNPKQPAVQAITPPTEVVPLQTIPKAVPPVAPPPEGKTLGEPLGPSMTPPPNPSNPLPLP
jgi:hypothetical protein